MYDGWPGPLTAFQKGFPVFFILLLRVLGLMQRSWAAPPSPKIFPFVSFNACWIDISAISPSTNLVPSITLAISRYPLIHFRFLSSLQSLKTIVKVAGAYSRLVTVVRSNDLRAGHSPIGLKD
jgi:hypothetical protein